MTEPKNVEIKDIEIIRNVRPDTDDVSELMDSIRQHGLMEPILVYKEEGKYFTIAGHRRLAAIKKLGKTELELNKEIKVLDKTPDIAELMILNLVENIVREQIEPISLGAICSELKGQYGLSLSELAARLSISRSRIAQAIDLYLKTPESQRQDVIYVHTTDNKRKGKGISASVQQKLNRIKNLTKEERKELGIVAKREELTMQDISTIRTLIQEGHDVKTALSECRNYRTLYMTIAVNRASAERFQEKTSEKIIDTIYKRIRTGKPDLPKDLFLK